MLHRLADLGNTVVVIEHNLDVIKTADWVIDLGPEAGSAAATWSPKARPRRSSRIGAGHTGRFLKPVLAAGPRAERTRFSPETKSTPGVGGKTRETTGLQASAIAAKIALARESESPERNGGTRGSSANDVAASTRQSERAKPESAISAEAKAPWEIDGRSWHTRDRVASNGRPIRWDGRILERIVDQIEALASSDSDTVSDSDSGFAPTDWSQRNVVRIHGSDKTKISFPFFHATTSSEWVVTLRFFVPKFSFSPGALAEELDLVPFHESPTPVLCDYPRVRIIDLGPFQEITIVGHALEEINTPAFDEFLREAAHAFLEIGKRRRLKTASELG